MKHRSIKVIATSTLALAITIPLSGFGFDKGTQGTESINNTAHTHNLFSSYVNMDTSLERTSFKTITVPEDADSTLSPRVKISSKPAPEKADKSYDSAEGMNGSTVEKSSPSAIITKEQVTTTTESASLSTTAVDTAPIIKGTGGKGGQRVNREFIEYSAHGLSGQYHLYADGIDWTEPVGVLFQFHGDKAYDFLNPNYKLHAMNTVAKEHNMVMVSLKAPNAENVWWYNIENHGTYARSLIVNEIYNKFNIDKDKVWLSGYSGGAEFITYEMMEEQSDLFTGGGALIFGGGGSPGKVTRTQSDELKENFKMLWYVGKDDNLNNSSEGWSAIADAQKGHDFYQRLGFQKISIVTPAGIDHFEYDEPKILSEMLTKSYG